MQRRSRRRRARKNLQLRMYILRYLQQPHGRSVPQLFGCIGAAANQGREVVAFPCALYHRSVASKEESVREVAEEMAASLAKGDTSSATRLAFRILERYEKSDWETRSRIVADRPATTGSDRYDALLAGVVELACATHQIVAPSWVNDNSYFLREWWFMSGMKSLHADALVHSPISLARRGVFVTQGALEYA